MKVQNPQNKALEEIQAQLAAKYQGMQIKKPFLTPRTLLVPDSNFKFLVRDKKGVLIIDFIPPVLWIIGAFLLSMVFASLLLSIIYGRFVFGFGGALFIILGFLTVKSIFKSANRSRFNAFYADLQQALLADSASAIF